MKLDDHTISDLISRPPSQTRTSGRAKDQLRQHVDGNDNFMRGFQIGKLKSYKKKIPRWVNNNEEIRKILLSAFPKLATDPRQRVGAARWNNVIHYYFRLRYTYVQTAEELSLKPRTVNDIVCRMNRVAAGRPANGSRKVSSDRHTV
jgi:hypothetical protein